MIVDAPRGSTSSSIEENLGFWIDEAAKTLVLADGTPLTVRRFDDHWISAARGDMSYEFDRQNGNLMYAGSTTKEGSATIIIGSGRCNIAVGPAGERTVPGRLTTKGSHYTWSDVILGATSGCVDKIYVMLMHDRADAAAVEVYLWELATTYMGIPAGDLLSDRCCAAASRLIGLRPQFETH